MLKQHGIRAALSFHVDTRYSSILTNVWVKLLLLVLLPHLLALKLLLLLLLPHLLAIVLNNKGSLDCNRTYFGRDASEVG